MYNVLALITLLLSSLFWLRALKPAGLAEYILSFFCLFTGQIIASGYILSSINRLSDLRYWSMLGLIAIAVSAVSQWTRGHRQFFTFPKVKIPSLTDLASLINRYTTGLSPFEKLVLSPLLLTTLLLGIFNLSVVIFTAPHQWDSMTYHLARVAYYLQHNNLNYFDANYYAQVTHPKNSAVLILYTYLVSGRNEALTQLVQFISYWIAICSIYAISRKVGNSQGQSLFAALVSALLIEWLMQATTPQNDLLLTAYIGAAVYFFFAFRATERGIYLALAGSNLCLAVGTKESAFLTLLPVGLIALYTMLRPVGPVSWLHRLQYIAILGMWTLLTSCIFALPAGYIENYWHFGHPIGPSQIREWHSFEGKTNDYIIQNGTKNLVRFGFDFYSLDGLPSANVVNKAQRLVRIMPEKLARNSGIELETTEATRVSFNLQKMPAAHEDLSYWGILGFGLIWPVVILAVVGIIKPVDLRILAVAACLFFLAQAYVGPYDPWRGRYFTTAAIFAVPVIGLCLQTQKRFWQFYLVLIILAGCVSATSAVVLKSNSTLISIRYQGKYRTSIFLMDRLEQLTRNAPIYYEPLRKFDELVPKDAVVAVYLFGDAFEYPLFGPYLTRTILPIFPFNKGLQPIPTHADYLLYIKEFPCADAKDIYLGVNWYLRRLTDNNRTCP